MQFQVATLQEIVSKIQYYCKLNFKNKIDIDILLEAEGLEIDVINSLIGAGVRIVGFSSLNQFIELGDMLLPCRIHYLGDLDTNNLTPVLSNFRIIESINNMDQIKRISDYNARNGKVSEVFVRMNVLSEIKKFGFVPSEIQDICMEIAKTSGVRLTGVNSYVPNIENEKMRKIALRKAGTIFKMLNARFRGFHKFSLNYLSHYEDLISEGVTQIRIGIKDLV